MHSISAKSILYVPGDRPRMLNRAQDLDADQIVVDLEDAVSPGSKAAALANAVDALEQARDRNDRRWWVRINEGAQGLEEATRLVQETPANGVWVPKATASDSWTRSVLSTLVAQSGIGLGLIVETALGLRDLAALLELVPADRALVGLGEEDLRADLRLPSPPDDGVVTTLRTHVVMACAAAGLRPPVGPVWVDLNDEPGLDTSTRRLRSQGFGSRACIHPAQLPTVNRLFGVSTQELDEARALVAEFEARAAAGEGVYRDASGRMVDEAVVRRARTLVAQHAHETP